MAILLTQFVLILSILNLPKLDNEKIDENSLLAAIPNPIIDEKKIIFNKIDNNSKIGEIDNNSKISEIDHKSDNNEDECCIASKNEDKNLKNIRIFNDWSYTPYLPTLVDNELKKLYMQRIYFYSIQHSANSTFDIDIELNSFRKLVGYAPRAIQVGLLSPFPSSWFAKNPSQLSNLMHIIAGLEMLFIYICLIGFVYSIFIWKNKLEFWLFICFSFYFTLIPTYAIPNIGSLIRYRYGAIMLLVAIGISALLKRYKEQLK